MASLMHPMLSRRRRTRTLRAGNVSVVLHGRLQRAQTLLKQAVSCPVGVGVRLGSLCEHHVSSRPCLSWVFAMPLMPLALLGTLALIISVFVTVMAWNVGRRSRHRYATASPEWAHTTTFLRGSQCICSQQLCLFPRH